eukprot:scaffold202711_cov32-Tisochrysis_lutea.AAC.4
MFKTSLASLRHHNVQKNSNGRMKTAETASDPIEIAQPSGCHHLYTSSSEIGPEPTSPSSKPALALDDGCMPTSMERPG